MARYIAWKDYYSVNDPALDNEHKQIIECINDLYVVVEANDAGDAIRRVLDQLVQYTNTHFSHEEARLKEIGFPALGEHKALHDEMRRRTLGLRTHLNLVTANDVLGFLKSWWINHIQGEDKLYASFMPAMTAK